MGNYRQDISVPLYDEGGATEESDALIMPSEADDAEPQGSKPSSGKGRGRKKPTEKHVVTLVAPNYIIVRVNGNGVKVKGRHNVKVGDTIELPTL